MGVTLDKRYTKLLDDKCIICNKQFRLGDEIDTSKTRRNSLIAFHTSCWKDEQELIKWQMDNRRQSS